MLVPAPPDDPIQIIDGRDLADWMLALAKRRGRIFNATGPERPLTMEDLLSNTPCWVPVAARRYRIFERSPMVDLDRENGIVRTISGSVEAGAVVLATGAWLAGVPELKRAVVAVSSDMVATAPMPSGSTRPAGLAARRSRTAV